MIMLVVRLVICFNIGNLYRKGYASKSPTQINYGKILYFWSKMKSPGDEGFNSGPMYSSLGLGFGLLVSGGRAFLVSLCCCVF